MARKVFSLLSEISEEINSLRSSLSGLSGDMENVRQQSQDVTGNIQQTTQNKFIDIDFIPTQDGYVPDFSNQSFDQIQYPQTNDLKRITAAPEQLQLPSSQERLLLNQGNIEYNIPQLQTQFQDRIFSDIGQKSQDEVSNRLFGGETQINSPIDRLKDDFKQTSTEVDNLSNSLGKLDSSSDEYIKKLKELERATAALIDAQKSYQDGLNEAKDSIQQGGGGSGGDGGDSFWDKFSKNISKGGAVATAIGAMLNSAGGGYKTYGNILQMGYGQDIGNELQQSQAVANSESIRMQRILGVQDLTQGSNAVRYFGDYVTGGEDFSHIGTEGLKRSRRLATDLSEREERYFERDYQYQGMGSLIQGGGAGMTALGSIAAGAALGAGGGAAFMGIGAIPGALMGGGIAALATLPSLFGSAKNTANVYANNQYSLSQGGLADTFMGDFLFGANADSMKERAFERFWLQRNTTREQYTEDLRSAEMKSVRAQEATRGYDLVQEAIRARQSGASSVGMFSTDALPGLSDKQQELLYGVRDTYDNEISNLNERLLEVPLTRELADYIAEKDAVNRFANEGNDKFTKLGWKSYSQILNEEKNKQEKELKEDRKQRENTRLQIESAQASRQSEIDAIIEPQMQYADAVAGFEMNLAEFANKQNQTTGMFFGGRASFDKTAEFIRLSRSGLGSSEQLAGNIDALQEVSGRQENFNQLKEIMTSAVSEGFNKSSMAQKFVSATVNMARSFGVADTSDISQELAGATSAISIGGESSILGMRLAQQGLAELAGFTGQTSGLTGNLKALGNITTGLGIGSSQMMLDKNMFQVNSMIKQIESGNFSDPNTQQALRSYLMDTTGTGDISTLTAEQKETAISGLRNQNESSLVGLKGIMAMQGSDYDDLMSQAKEAAESGDTEKLQQITSRLGGFTSQIQGMSEFTGASLIASSIDMGAVTPEARRNLQEQIRLSNYNYSNKANVERIRYFNRLAAKTRTNMISEASGSDVQKYFSQGGDALMIETDQGVESISNYEEYQSRRESFTEGGATYSDLMSGMQSKIAERERGYQNGIDYISSSAMMSLQKAISAGISSAYGSENPIKK